MWKKPICPTSVSYTHLDVYKRQIRYYEKAGIVYSKKDPSSGYRYFTPADIYALLDVLFYRSMDIPVEEVRNIMNSYQHRDVKKLLEQKQEQVQAKIREQQVLLERIRATIEDYRIMEENLDVFQDVYKRQAFICGSMAIILSLQIKISLLPRWPGL